MEEEAEELDNSWIREFKEKEEEYDDFYKDGDDVFAYDNNIELQSLLNKTHSLHTASENTRIT